MINQYKKVICFIVTLAIMIGMSCCLTDAIATDSYDFSIFTEADSMAFVEECGIDIPEELMSDSLPSFTKELILYSYNHPNTPFNFNHGVTQGYAEEIRLAVKDHMNATGIPMVASETTYSLQYNTVRDENGNWVTSGGYYDAKWNNYNCYAYSIHRAESEPYYSSTNYLQYHPGDMSGQGGYIVGMSVNQVAALVVADLACMGYTNITSLTSIPNEITSSQELICVRVRNNDYHFMRYDLETDAWYHKPGISAILKYNTVPSNSEVWHYEDSIEGVERFVFFPYDSEIIFIKYDKNQIPVPQSTVSRKYIQYDKDTMCEFDISSAGTYRIQMSASPAINYDVFNEDFDVVSSGSGSSIDCYISFAVGKYYLRMDFIRPIQSRYVDIRICKYSYWDICDDWHNYTCDACGEVMIEEPHEYIRYGPNIGASSGSTHRHYCHCGYYRVEYHTIRAPESGTVTFPATCIFCGGTAMDGNITMSIPPELSEMSTMGVNPGTYTLSDGTTVRVLTENGSYVLPSGIIVLVDEDADLAEAGLLDPYALVENLPTPSNPGHVTE